MRIYSNTDFCTKKNLAVRKKWAQALLSTTDKQGYNTMEELFPRDDGVKERYSCCLNVARIAFGNTGNLRSQLGFIRANTKFYQALSQITKSGMFVNEGNGEKDVVIGWEYNEGNVTASMCNDTYRLTFKQIANLVCPELFGKVPGKNYVMTMA